MGEISIDRNDYGDVEGSTMKSLEMYVNHGYHPGDFLTCVIENNVDEALRYADPTRKDNLSDIVEMVKEVVPSKYRGSKDAVGQCIDDRGLSQ